MSVAARAAGEFRTWNRRRKASWLAGLAQQHDVQTVLLVGAGGDDQPWENQVERSLADHRVAIWCGIDERANLTDYVRCDGGALPFRDGAFDLVFSNAVVEHVGDEWAQRRFIAEHARVGRVWAATTPNRWFPIESHTLAVLRHWSRRWRDRQPEFTRLLSRRELANLCPPGTEIVGSPLAPTFTAHGASGSRRGPTGTQTADGPSASRQVHRVPVAVHPPTVDSNDLVISNRIGNLATDTEPVSSSR